MNDRVVRMYREAFNKLGRVFLKRDAIPESIRAEQIDKNDFSFFTYSKIRHFAFFGDNDVALYGSRIDSDVCDLKVYQDLLVYTFIQEHVPKGSKLLEIGGGASRIIEAVKHDYECWNLDKLEGLGNGPASVNSIEIKGFRLVADYIGNFSTELPDDYFDFVFSISALEHTPGDAESNRNICKDINRVMKQGALSLHCFDVVLRNGHVWTNDLLPYIFDNIETINPFVPFSALLNDTSLYSMSEKSYNSYWRETTKKTYQEFGKPLSYNVLWKKIVKTEHEGLVRGHMNPISRPDLL